MTAPRGLFDERRHACAQCLRAPARLVVMEREGSGTAVWARCHGRLMRQRVPDADIEDGKRVLWFVMPTDGELYESKRERERRLLLEEIEAERARRATREGGP